MFIIKIVCFVVAVIALVLFTIAAVKSKKGIASMFLITYIFFWGLLCYSAYIELIYSSDAIPIVSNVKTESDTSTDSGKKADMPNGSLSDKENDSNGNSNGKIVGNKDSMIYHVPGSTYYNKAIIKESNNVYFNTEEEAVKAGYRPPKK
ncbi:hypothetical protein [Clostridium cylindrosporum]|uniref:Uncharacterized protein n=1 Tax=Clostridium cylindrosporum DSM 605 TaxID=1121307 RepID=A0A0J8DFT6_CLOCY|nr:hypothetical protein [Clostridium cylindrosporum]KMT23023.1 hypothetical protein CLCY_7c00700 [Clostridium cylindrosporum DSM 605]